MYKKEVVKCKK